MLAFLAAWWARSKLLTVLGAAAAWVFADWRRVATLAVVIALVVTYLVADYRRGKADAVFWQARLDAQAKAFLTAADKAATDEHARQAQIGADVSAAFQKQQVARDAADAQHDAELEQEIADYEKKLAAAGRSHALDADDIGWLRNDRPAQPATPPGGH